MMPAIALLVQLNLKPGTQDQYIELATAHQRRVLKNEPGCKCFDILIPDEGADVVHLYEVYADEEAFSHHMETPYMKTYREQSAVMVANRHLTRCAVLDAG
jgi:quinol monooxygenase YgiN